MRPLLVDLGRDYRGGQHQAFLLLRGLLAAGHSPELIAVRDSELARRAHEAGIPVCSVNPKRRRFSATLALRRLVRARHVDLVHANEPHALSAVWLAGAHRFVPVVASRRIALPLSPGSFALARYRAASCIVAVSNFVRQSIVDSSLEFSSIQVIYDGVEIPALPIKTACPVVGDIPWKNPRIGNVAALVPEKGHALLLRALVDVRQRSPECSLLLAGEGPEKTNLETLARQLGLAEAVTFRAPPLDLENIFSQIDIFVFPSHAEPLGSALLAAMACGLPVVAIAAGGIPEVVQSGINGLLVEKLEPALLAEAICRILTDPEAARKRGEAAHDTITKQFSAERMVQETSLLYERLIAAHGLAVR